MTWRASIGWIESLLSMRPTRAVINCGAEDPRVRPRLAIVDAGPADGDHAPLRTYVLRDVVSFGETALVCMIEDDAVYILNESVSHPWSIRDIYKNNIKYIQRLTATSTFDTAACIIDIQYSANIWHWFFESVTRLLALEVSGFQGHYFIADNPLHKHVLSLLGIPDDRIMIRSFEAVAFKELVVTACFDGSSLNTHPWLLKSLRQKLRKEGADYAESTRIYIGRRGTARSVVNEKEISNILKRYGFVTIYMEDYNIEEQIRIASNASMIVGPHGAGMAFAVFMKEGGTLIEFFNSRYVIPCMLSVCDVFNIQYRALPSFVFPQDNHRTDDLINVDIMLFELSLRQAVDYDTKFFNAGAQPT